MSKVELGKKIKLIKMVDEKDPIPSGTIGTITSITKLYESFILGVKWENSSRTLNVCLPEDQVEFLD